MPYIPIAARDELDDDPLAIEPNTEGELNYVITKAVDDYLQLKGVRYATLNACMGVLECAKLELYRRIAAPYEDAKLIENGDVYSEEVLKALDKQYDNVWTDDPGPP